MAKKKSLYPGVAEAEAERSKCFSHYVEDEPDFIGGKPNYKKFEKFARKWTCEEILVWLNID